MNDDQPGNGSGKMTWVEKIGQAFSHQPRTRDEFLEVLRQACDDGILDADALAMMEGALEVSETQVRDANAIPSRLQSSAVAPPRPGSTHP